PCSSKLRVDCLCGLIQVPRDVLTQTFSPRVFGGRCYSFCTHCGHSVYVLGSLLDYLLPSGRLHGPVDYVTPNSLAVSVTVLNIKRGLDYSLHDAQPSRKHRSLL